MEGTTAIIISLEVVLDTRVPLTEEAEARAGLGDLTARPEAGVEGKEVNVDVNAPWISFAFSIGRHCRRLAYALYPSSHRS